MQYLRLTLMVVAVSSVAASSCRRGASENCEDDARALQAAIAEARECDTNDDCTEVRLGCPFGCGVAVSVKRQAALSERASAWAARCTPCKYKCRPPVGGARCIDRRCTVSPSDEGWAPTSVTGSADSQGAAAPPPPRVKVVPAAAGAAGRQLALCVRSPSGAPATGCEPVQLAREGKGPYRWAWSIGGPNEQVFGLGDDERGRTHLNVRCREGQARVLVDLGPDTASADVQLREGDAVRVEFPPGLGADTVHLSLAPENGLWDLQAEARGPLTLHAVPPGWYRPAGFAECLDCGKPLCAGRLRVASGRLQVLRLKRCP